jgi:hypothetical protein
MIRHSVKHAGRSTITAISPAYAIALLTSMLLDPSVPAKTLERPAQPSLRVTPLTGIASSGPQGGPFLPESFLYHVSASSGTVNYSIRTPTWLTASSSFGTADASGVTITLTIDSSASSLPPGAYGPAVAFTNATNGRGTATRPAKLVIVGSLSPPSSTGRTPDSRLPSAGRAPSLGRGYLLDNGPGHLLDHDGGKLLAQ